MNKGILAAVLFCLLLLIVACGPKGIGPTPAPEAEGEAGGEAEDAQPDILFTEVNGDVFVNGEPATVGMEVKEGDVITTGAGATAEIEMFSGAVLRLDENSEVRADELTQEGISVTQLAGKTWNKLLKLSGINRYSVQGGSVVATVRGTAFALYTDEEETIVKVEEGTVVAVVDEVEEEVVEGEQVEVTEDKIVVDLIEEDTFVAQNRETDLQFLSRVEKRMLKRHASKIREIKRKHKLSDEEMKEWVGAYVAGHVDAPIPPSKEEFQKRIAEKRAQVAAREKNMERIRVLQQERHRIVQEVRERGGRDARRVKEITRERMREHIIREREAGRHIPIREIRERERAVIRDQMRREIAAKTEQELIAQRREMIRERMMQEDALREKILRELYERNIDPSQLTPLQREQLKREIYERQLEYERIEYERQMSEYESKTIGEPIPEPYIGEKTGTLVESGDVLPIEEDKDTLIAIQ